MIILALETSQRQSSVALRDRSGQVHVEALRAEKRHDDDLLPAIDRLVRACGLTPKEIEGVAVSVGPGGFTGLRIAVATTKMLALALGCGVIAVPSALIVAESTDAPGARRVLVVLAAKGGSAWITRLERVDDRWEIRAENLDASDLTTTGAIANADEVDLDGVDVVFADAHAPPALIERCAAKQIMVIEPHLRADACLEIAARRFAVGVRDDPWTLTPLYPRPPEAVTLWERRRAEGR